MGIKEDLAAAEQQPKCSAAQLRAYGRIWRTYVGLAKDSGNSGNRQLVIDSLNKNLDDIGIKATRGFQAYDPVVRSGKAKKYTALVTTISSDNDGGAGQAAAILNWMAGTAAIGTLSDAARDFAVITHFAEVARGFLDAPTDIAGMLGSIATAKPASAAQQQWQALATQWAPATTYAQDVKTDWVPTPGDDYDIPLVIDSDDDEFNS